MRSSDRASNWRSAGAVLACVAASVTAGCGAKTGLAVQCRVPLTRVPADVVLVADRSDTMGGGMLSDGRTIWQGLVDGVAQSFPAFDEQVVLGALYLPTTSMDGCSVAPTLGVPLARRNASAVVDYLRRAEPPRGGTPLFEALRTASIALRARRRNDGWQFIVIGTDGGANCNPDIRREECDCELVVPCFGPDGEFPRSCFDGARTSQQLREFVRERIGTLLVGLQLHPQSGHERWLNEMALAGGFPAPGPDRYYRVDRPEEIAGALRRVLRRVTACRLAVPEDERIRSDRVAMSAPTGGALPHDATRTNGWEWVDGARREIVVHGAACDQLAEANEEPSLTTLDRLCTTND